MLNAAKNARSHLNPTQPDQFTAENALPRSVRQGKVEATKPKPKAQESILFNVFFVLLFVLVERFFCGQNLNIIDWLSLRERART